MIQKHFEDIIRKKFGYDFSPTQQIAVEHFIRFFFAREEEGIFLLKGYAGTGKTSLVAAIVNALVSLEYKVVLLAPTGRAAKVFAGLCPRQCGPYIQSAIGFLSSRNERPYHAFYPCFLSMRLR